MAITAKEYLSQLEELEKKVKHKKQQLAEAKKNRGIVTISNDSEVGKVQTSFSGGDGRRTESQALRVVSLEEEIENKIIDYMELQNKLIDQIHDLKDGLFIEILYAIWDILINMLLICTERHLWHLRIHILKYSGK